MRGMLNDLGAAVRERREQFQRERGRIDMIYGMLDAQLTEHEFLAGDAFTIAECAAVAVKAMVEAGEDEVAIFVVTATPDGLDEAGVREWCEQRLPRFAIPEVVEIVGELPKTPSGKVRKIELRERLEAQQDAFALGHTDRPVEAGGKA